MDFIYNRGESERSGFTEVHFGPDDRSVYEKFIEHLPESGLEYMHGTDSLVILAGIVERRYIFRTIRGEPLNRHCNPEPPAPLLERIPPSDFVA